MKGKMGKNNKSTSNLGRSLIKDRFGSSRNRRRTSDPSLLHTAEIDDGYDWGRLNLQSVTEESSFKEFLSTAELAGTEFQAEKLNITFVNPRSGIGLLSAADKVEAHETQEKNKQQLRIPRRPKWDSKTTAEELQTAERDQFLEWRRSLAQLQEIKGILLTPYEKNLEFWRQLWRVVERSDVVAQIVDARNPLLFRCEDLECYVKEVKSSKLNLILINKADFLTLEQRQFWANYFSAQNIQVAFFSATLAAEKEIAIEEGQGDDDNSEHESDTLLKEKESEDVVTPMKQSDNATSHNLSGIPTVSVKHSECQPQLMKGDSTTTTSIGLGQSSSVYSQFVDDLNRNMPGANTIQNLNNDNCLMEGKKYSDTTESVIDKVSEYPKNSAELLTRKGLISFFKSLHVGSKETLGVTTIGLVGYPNVGKSSTINALLTHKKVSVSATPGKTKHFQTLFLDQDLLLCDCPGLVMPSFVFTKAEMITNGILPIDQMRDHVPPVTLVVGLIPKQLLEDKYGLMLPDPMEGEDPNRPPTAEEFLNAYGYNRGFMTQNGMPDNPRAARYILKDFVNGKLLYCYAPPGLEQNEYHTFPERRKPIIKKLSTPASRKILKSNKTSVEDLDHGFFSGASAGAHCKGTFSKPGSWGHNVPEGRSSVGSSVNDSTTSLIQSAKPWKNHQNKRNKREKLRRLYSHLDN